MGKVTDQAIKEIKRKLSDLRKTGWQPISIEEKEEGGLGVVEITIEKHLNTKIFSMGCSKETAQEITQRLKDEITLKKLA